MRKTVEARLFNQIRKVCGRLRTKCWEFTGTLDDKGYGRIKIKGKMRLAHRISFELRREPPGQLFVLHKCDNARCVNPGHLYLGDHDDNVRDRVARGRSARIVGESNSRAKLTDAQREDLVAEYVCNDVTQAQLAVKFGIHRSTVGDIVQRSLNAAR